MAVVNKINILVKSNGPNGGYASEKWFLSDFGTDTVALIQAVRGIARKRAQLLGQDAEVLGVRLTQMDDSTVPFQKIRTLRLVQESSGQSWKPVDYDTSSPPKQLIGEGNSAPRTIAQEVKVTYSDGSNTLDKMCFQPSSLVDPTGEDYSTSRALFDKALTAYSNELSKTGNKAHRYARHIYDKDSIISITPADPLNHTPAQIVLNGDVRAKYDGSKNGGVNVHIGGRLLSRKKCKVGTLSGKEFNGDWRVQSITSLEGGGNTVLNIVGSQCECPVMVDVCREQGWVAKVALDKKELDCMSQESTVTKKAKSRWKV